MSPLRMGQAKVTGVNHEALVSAAHQLGAALHHGEEELPAAKRARASSVIDKVAQRTGLVGGHTVIALAGATGSGKSSLFNAIVGHDVATVGARRPTTSTPTAAVWGGESAGDLLDWLLVSKRHQVPSEEPEVGKHAATVGSLDGLVLLDLPDFDSRETANRAEAERILDLVDVFCWVTDPQKYADARLHDDYVAALSHHDAVTVVVLNQIDRLTPDEVDQCTEDLKRLMTVDGLPDATIIPVSARTGAGLARLKQRLSNAVVGENAARTRLAADVRTSAGSLLPHVASGEPDLSAADDADLVSALSRSAGVPTVVDAVTRDYRMEAASHTGWPFTRWTQNLRARPLRRLRLAGDDVSITESDLRAVLGRSSIPPPTPAAKAAVELATRRLADRAGDGMPTPWFEAVDAAASPPGEELTDALDLAVMRTKLRERPPLWWRIVGMLQVLLALAVVAGFIWYVVLMLLQWLQFSMPPVPKLADVVPIPFVLLVGGVVGGLLLAALSKWVAGVGAKRRAEMVERRLGDAVAEVADTYIVAPVSAVLMRHRATRQALESAAGL